jgi:hypothetical protein
MLQARNAQLGTGSMSLASRQLAPTEHAALQTLEQSM